MNTSDERKSTEIAKKQMAREKSEREAAVGSLESRMATAETVNSNQATVLQNHASRIAALENFMNRSAGFAGASHHHDDIYYRQASLYTRAYIDGSFYTQGQSDNRFAPASHGNTNHSTNFLPRTEFDGHTHDTRYFTQAQCDNRYATANHIH